MCCFAPSVIENAWRSHPRALRGHSSAVLDSHDLHQPSLLRVGRAGIRTEPFAAEIERNLDEQQNMTTLYDLLGALPGDDADDLRDAFRRAVKDVHPDISPNDPDAALKFRLLVYAMEVLRDPEQRAAYDHLLELAQQELVSQQTAAKLRNFAFAMLGLASATVVAVGMSILLAPTSKVAAPARQIDGFPHASSGIASESLSARPGLNDNSTAATRDAQTTKPAEVQDDFLSRWGANDIYAKVDHDAEIPKPVEEQNAPLPRSGANDTSAPAGGDAESRGLLRRASRRQDLIETDDRARIRPKTLFEVMPGGVPDEIMQLARGRERVQVIKQYRALNGATYEEAQAWLRTL